MNETLSDLLDDLIELESLTSSSFERIGKHKAHLEKAKQSYEPGSHAYLLKKTVELSETYENLLQDLRIEIGAKDTWIESDNLRLIAFKKAKADLLRILQNNLGSVLSAGNWQSPSFAHTRLSQAGNRTGDIKVNMNDYTRDLHMDGTEYARLFINEYVDQGFRFPPWAFLTSSCMSALTTTLVHFASTMEPDDVALAGKTIYFQNKIVIEMILPGRVIFFDEFDTDAILALAKKHKPKIILLDSLCGTASLAMPNLSKLIPSLSRILSYKSVMIVDISATAAMYQPFRDLPVNPLGMQLIVIASLSKYFEWGQDRVHGGVIIVPVTTPGLLQARMHLGTILSDTSTLSLPVPNRKLFTKRLMRIGRNATLLAGRIDAYAHEHTCSLSHVVHPRLPTYRGYSWTKDLPFTGGVFTLEFKQKYHKPSYHKNYVARVLSIAKKRNVDIIGGAGFGFDTTRIYFIGPVAEKFLKTSFVRIAVGTETMDEVAALGDVLIAAL